MLLLGGLGAAGLLWLRSYQASLERQEALRLSQQGHFDQAEAGLLRVYARNASDIDSVRALALGYLTAARDPEAAIYLARWCELQPDLAEPHRQRMEWLERHEDLVEAAAEGERVLELDPADSQLQKRVILMHLKEGRYADVERLSRRLLERQPGHPGLVYFLAEACHGLGKNDEAAALLDPLLPAQPGFAAPPMLRAILYCEANQEAQAIPLLRRVLALDPSSKTAHYHLAQALARLGQSAEAEREKADYLRLEEFERLRTDMRLQPGNLELQIKGAQAYLQRGQKEEAMRLLRRVMAQDPGNQAARRLLEER
jgi:tetratricopeptide (TPR) repeat protein